MYGWVVQTVQRPRVSWYDRTLICINVAGLTMKLHYLLAAAILPLVSACDLQPPPVEQRGPVDEGAPTLAQETTVGDLEADINVEVALAEDFEHPSVNAEEVRTRPGKQLKYAITVTEPYPDSLPIQFRVRAHRTYADAVVPMRVEVVINDEVHSTFSGVLDRDSAADTYEKTVDIFAPYEEAPDRILAFGRLKAMLLPADTGTDTLDPETVTAPPDHTTTILGALVTVDFKGGT